MMQPGSAVVVYLQEPREQIWGVLRGLDPNGVVVEGLEIGSFDAWMRCVEEGSGWRAQISTQFFPTHRIQRIVLDRGAPEAPSLSERFEARMGKPVELFFSADESRP